MGGHEEQEKSTPTPEEIRLARDVLSRLEPGLLPFEIFKEVARIWVTPIIELVPLRRGANGTEVLLFKRPDDDPVWGGQLHTPGTVLRSTDTSSGFNGALERIEHDELGAAPKTVSPRFVSTVFHQVARGSELSTVFYADMGDIPVENGQWYPARQLPENIVDTQIGFISDCVRMFEGGEQ